MSVTPLLPVAAGRVITLRYRMYNRHDELVEDRTKGEPVSYLQGGSAVLPGLQQQLEGMKAGERRMIVLDAENGNATPDFRFDLLLVSVRKASDAEIEIGYPLPLSADCGADCDCFFEPGVKPFHKTSS